MRKTVKTHRVALFPAVLFFVAATHLVLAGGTSATRPDSWQATTPTADVSVDMQQAAQLYHDGFALHQSGELQDALDTYEQALSLYRQLNDPAGEGKTLNNMGFVCRDMGKYARAMKYYQEAIISLRAAGDRFNEGAAISNLAVVYMVLGQYQQSLDHFEEALVIRQEVGDLVGQGVTLSNIGIAYSDLGEYEQALSYLQQALAIRREVSDREGEAATLNGIGLTYWRLKQYKNSLNYYQQALTIYREIDRRVGEGSVLNNIGETYYDLGNYTQALESYQNALDIFQSIGVRGGEGTVLNNIGETYHKLDQTDLALEYLQQSLTILQEIGQPVTEAIALNNLGEVYDDQEQDEKALFFFEQALVIREEVGDRPGKAKTLHNIGWIYEQRGDRANAIAGYQQAIEVIESIQSDIKVDDLKASFASGQVETYERLIGLLWVESRWSDAFTYVERARARALLDQLTVENVDFRVGADARLLEQERALRDEIAALRTQLVTLRNRTQTEWDTTAIAALDDQLRSREADYTQILTDIKLQSPEIASLVSVNVTSLADVQALVDTNTTLVEYFLTKDRILVFIITNETFDTVTVDVSREELTKVIASFREFASLNDAHPASLMQLYAWLIAPLKEKLKTPVVGVIPHGVLHYLPFAALTDGKQYLSDEYSLFMLPSASVFRFIQEKRKPPPNSILALGNPAITEPGMASLHFAESEVEDIATLFGTKPLIGEAATESALRSQVSGAGIVHLAAHGQYNGSNPLFSVIYLAAGGGEDGRLEVNEIYGLDLTKATDLVVLSACETQVGEVSAGDEVVGMTRAFLYAGTPTVIASLWKVDDEATTLLMERFYQHLREGMGKAQALQQAQSEIRAQYLHPYYWAAFVLTGDAGVYVPPASTSSPLNNDRGSSIAGIGSLLRIGLCGLGVVTILVGGIIWWRQRKEVS